jgi:hypothetical protein
MIPGISVRLVSVLSVVLIAALALFVVKDRSRLESQIHSRQARYVSCSRDFRGRKLAATKARVCGWSQLSERRLGDLVGLPFFAVALGLTLILVYKIGRPEATGQGVGRFGDPRPDDPVL